MGFSMHIETRTAFVADDGTRFNDEIACKKYEEKRTAFRAMIAAKIGEFDDSELLLGGHATIDSLPYKAPWMSAYGACFIHVTDIRRVDGVLRFQVADLGCTPYDNGNVWCRADEFYSEWPD